MHLMLLTTLSACTPHALEETVLLCQSIHAIVALAHSPHESTQGIDLVLAGIAAVLVNLAD
jgi:hypothetical protein